VALQVPFPTPEGVKTPLGVIVPPVAVQATAVLKLPVPLTVATQVDVCTVVMADGVATTVTLVTVESGVLDLVAGVPELLPPQPIWKPHEAKAASKAAARIIDFIFPFKSEGRV